MDKALFFRYRLIVVVQEKSCRSGVQKGNLLVNAPVYAGMTSGRRERSNVFETVLVQGSRFIQKAKELGW
jgi:hypothetical protein